MAIALLYWVICLSCWAYALRFGGRAGLWFVICFLLTTLGTVLATPGEVAGVFGLVKLPIWTRFNPFLFAVDTLFLIALLFIAKHYIKAWACWAAGFQLISVTSHLGLLLDRSNDPQLYRGLESVWAIPILLVMVLGVSKDRAAGYHDLPHRHRTSY